MKIVFFGTPTFVIPILETLIDKFTVVAVVTAPDRKAGRKQLLTPSPVKKFYQYYCEQHTSSINKIYPDNIFTAHEFSTLNSQLSTLKPDLFVVAAYGQILPDAILKIPPFGAINVHPSLLPKFRGPSPVPETILSGDKVTGVTLIKMDNQMDHGPILATKAYEIHETDTSETLLNHLFHLSAEMLPDVITNYTNGKIIPQAQDDSKATYTKKIAKEDGNIDLLNPPDKEKLSRMIKAYYPWPTVWTKVSSVDASPKGEAILSPNSTNAKLIKFLPGGKIQMEGKNPISIKDFINGYPELKQQLEKIYSD